jgi:hypothetical protein
MVVLTAALTDDDRKSLIGEWVVASEADYGRLMSVMEDLGKKYSSCFAAQTR